MTIPVRNHVCSTALFREDGAVALQHRDNKPSIILPNTWVLPGGHMDAGETSLECARRELREETGYMADNLQFLLTIVDDFQPGFPAYLLDIYWAMHDGKQPLQCFEGQALEFVTLEKARKLPCNAILFEVWELAWKRARLEMKMK